MSETGHLLEFACMTGLCLSITENDPYMPLIRAMVIAQLLQGDDKLREKILLGGPDIISW